MRKLLKKLATALRGKTLTGDWLLGSFERNRQKLQQAFFAMAARSGKPRGLLWKDCTWLSTYALTRDPATQLITLFCGVNLSFEAVAGGDMEDVDAVSTVRDATAVFHWQDGRWGTGGRVLFNVDPQTAVTVAAVGQEVLLVKSESHHDVSPGDSLRPA